jgi:zinc-binding alcohol dehydrogenase family protein
MKAVAYTTPGPIDREDALIDITVDIPQATGRDLLVNVKAVSVNPVDTKLRRKQAPLSGQWGILGFDAAGIVDAVGPEVEHFQPGDAVFYAGSLARPGTNSEYHRVDERIVGRKPTCLSYGEAAALPLTALTAWEMLFHRLEVQRPTPQGGDTILVIGGAGGVGSIALQLLRARTDLTLIATASRPETEQWARRCGAHQVINHHRPLAPQVKALGLGAPGFVFSTTQTQQHWADIADLMAPQGRFGLIDDPAGVDLLSFKRKSLSLHWEFMFTRPWFATPDMAEQGQVLTALATLVETGQVQSTLTEVAGKIDAATLRRVHARIETGSTCGKIVLEGF